MVGIVGGLLYLGFIAGVLFVIRWYVWADKNPGERFSQGLFAMKIGAPVRKGRRQNGRNQIRSGAGANPGDGTQTARPKTYPGG